MSLGMPVTPTTSLALWETRAGTIRLSHPGTPALRNCRTLDSYWIEPAQLGQLGIWKQTMHKP